MSLAMTARVIFRWHEPGPRPIRYSLFRIGMGIGGGAKDVYLHDRRSSNISRIPTARKNDAGAAAGVATFETAPALLEERVHAVDVDNFALLFRKLKIPDIRYRQNYCGVASHPAHASEVC